MNSTLKDILDGPSPQAAMDYYTIIGCHESANEEQIQTEYKKRALELHPDKQDKESQASEGSDSLEAFQRLQEAREVLLDPEMRAKYDRWRKSGLAIPFKQYANIKCTSLHWVTRAQKDLAVTDGSVASLSKKDDMDYGQRPGPASGRRQTLTGGESSLRSWRAQGPGEAGENATSDELLRKFRNYEI